MGDRNPWYQGIASMAARTETKGRSRETRTEIKRNGGGHGGRTLQRQRALDRGRKVNGRNAAALQRDADAGRRCQDPATERTSRQESFHGSASVSRIAA